MRSILLDKRGNLRLEAVLGAVVGLVASVMYLRSLAPDVLPYAQMTQDSPALQATVPSLGISHPTGYPGYMLLAHLVTYLPVGDLAYRVNLASAVFGVLAVLLVYLVGLRLSGGGIGGALAAATGALAFGLCRGFWNQAIIAEVYTLNAAFLALVCLVLFVWRERRRDRYLLLAAFLCGLSLTNHLTSGLLLPAGLAFVFLVDRRKLAEAGLWSRGALLFAIGLLPYIYLPLRASARLPENMADTSTLSGFITVVSGGPFKGWMFSFGPAELPGRIVMYLGYLGGQFPLPLLLIGIFGAGYMILRDRAGAAMLGVIFAGTVIYAVEYNVSDVYVFFLPTYLVLGLWLATGLGALSRMADDRIGGLLEADWKRYVKATPWLPGLGLALVLLGAAGTYGQVDRSGDYKGREMIRTVIQNVEPGATVVHRRSPLLYMQKVEHRRQDITLWDFHEPHTRKGVEAANEALMQGRVYMLSPRPETIKRFEQDYGYRLKPVHGDMLYWAIPPKLQGTASPQKAGYVDTRASKNAR